MMEFEFVDSDLEYEVKRIMNGSDRVYGSKVMGEVEASPDKYPVLAAIAESHIRPYTVITRALGRCGWTREGGRDSVPCWRPPQ